MKLKVNQSDEYEELEIEIKCKQIDKRVEKIIYQIKQYSSFITGKKDNSIYQLAVEDIYYIESMEDRTFIYLMEDIYDSNERLYELESKLINTNFIRISKNCILNIDMLSNVKALLNGKYEAELLNNEKLIISRHYVPEFKKKFGL